MKTAAVLTFAFIASSTLAFAQSPGGGTGGSAGTGAGAAGTAGTSPSAVSPSTVPSGTPGTSGAFNPGGVGVPGGAGPGDTTSYPNQPAMRPNNPTVGNGPGGSFSGSELNS